MLELAKKLLYSNQMKFGEGKFTVLNVPCLVTIADSMIGTQKDLIASLGGKGIELIYKASKEEGKGLYNTFLKTIKKKDECERFFLEYLMMGGWGKFEVFQKTSEGIILINKNAPFPERHGQSRDPVCHIMRGLLAGAYSEVFGREMEGQETKCRAQGANLCAFKITSKQ